MVLGPVPMGTDLSEGAREKLRDHPLWGGLGPLPLHRKAGAQARRRGPWVEAQEELGGGCRGPGLWSGEAWATAGEAAALAEGGQRQHRGSLAPARPPTECCPATARRALGRPALTPPACLSPEAEACVCGRPRPRLLQNWRPCSTPVGLPAGLLQGQVGAGPALLRPRSPGGRAGRRGSANVSPPKAWVGGSAYFREGPPISAGPPLSPSVGSTALPRGHTGTAVTSPNCRRPQAAWGLLGRAGLGLSRPSAWVPVPTQTLWAECEEEAV